MIIEYKNTLTLKYAAWRKCCIFLLLYKNIYLQFIYNPCVLKKLKLQKYWF